MKKAAFVLSCFVLLSAGVDASTLKKLHSKSDVRPLAEGREELESGGAIDHTTGKHCPISHVKFLKCASGADFTRYQHPADDDGPWWQGSYDAGE